MKQVILPGLILLILSCSTFQRSPQSGYGNSPEHSDERKKSAYELGYNPNSRLSESQLQNIDKRYSLKMLERRLETEQEKEQYSKILPWLVSEEERIAFLSIPTLEGRQAWIIDNNISQRAMNPPRYFIQAMEENDISIGMPQDFVKKAWGEPQDRFVSGNPIYKNERWRYSRYISSTDGYKKETRNVYFESGRVVGWDTE